MFDDFPIASDRGEGAAPLGEGNMAQVYDTAIVYLDRGLAVATATNSGTLRTQILAMRAQAEGRPDFDLKEFHGRMLRAGAIRLDHLQRVMS